MTSSLEGTSTLLKQIPLVFANIRTSKDKQDTITHLHANEAYNLHYIQNRGLDVDDASRILDASNNRARREDPLILPVRKSY